MTDEAIIGTMSPQTIRILSASAVRQAMTAAAQDFHIRTGASLHLHFGTSGAVEQRINAGESFDVVAASLAALQALHKADRIGAPVAVGASRIALGLKDGVPAPDVSTLEKFRAVMLAARSIARGDPAGGGTAGNHLQRALERIDLLEPTRAKTLLKVGGYKVMQEVAEDRADFGLTQSTEIVAVDGVHIAAWLPEEVQMTTIYAVAPALSPSAPGAFFTALVDGHSDEIYRRAGFFPA
ncbi:MULTISPECIES: substrate-binding domain-containing protein [unclassified Beijerinckia]|uniref:substrate-binding domain-containing protein n=1 Tax=unclassified Beijerinckia TaxID=2638183 RepID=UPI000895A4C7|nr:MULTISPECIES: substrate-binding domain-containing protein [unclassified Beijerinckia]MDH7798703.1 molybdate transport system substrate-binding protein [Beijerinckia sp. GAS462]SED30109.1 molybdate transport system substrate-binding protein [Beijerinckia sp. 28-YEA-48]